MQSLWLIIVVFFLILIILPIFTRAYVSFDMLGNLGAVSVYVLFIKIIAYKIRYSNGQIIVFTNKDKKEVEVQVSNKQLRFLKQLSVQIKQKIIIKNISVFSRIGLNDACNTAICSGLFNIVVSSLLAYIKNTKKSAKFNVINSPDYNGSHLTFSIVVSCFITIFDLLYAMLISLIIIKRSEKYERV